MLTAVENYIRTHRQEPTALHSQCAWCALVYDGEFAGMLLFRTQDETLVRCLPETFTHGCCEQCEKRMVERRRSMKLRQRSTPEERDGVLYF